MDPKVLQLDPVLAPHLQQEQTGQPDPSFAPTSLNPEIQALDPVLGGTASPTPIAEASRTGQTTEPVPGWQAGYKSFDDRLTAGGAAANKAMAGWMLIGGADMTEARQHVMTDHYMQAQTDTQDYVNTHGYFNLSKMQTVMPRAEQSEPSETDQDPDPDDVKVSLSDIPGYIVSQIPQLGQIGLGAAYGAVGGSVFGPGGVAAGALIGSALTVGVTMMGSHVYDQVERGVPKQTAVIGGAIVGAIGGVATTFGLHKIGEALPTAARAVFESESFREAVAHVAGTMLKSAGLDIGANTVQSVTDSAAKYFETRAANVDKPFTVREGIHDLLASTAQAAVVAPTMGGITALTGAHAGARAKAIHAEIEKATIAFEQQAQAEKLAAQQKQQADQIARQAATQERTETTQIKAKKLLRGYAEVEAAPSVDAAEQKLTDAREAFKGASTDHDRAIARLEVEQAAAELQHAKFTENLENIEDALTSPDTGAALRTKLTEQKARIQTRAETVHYQSAQLEFKKRIAKQDKRIDALRSEIRELKQEARETGDAANTAKKRERLERLRAEAESDKENYTLLIQLFEDKILKPEDLSFLRAKVPAKRLYGIVRVAERQVENAAKAGEQEQRATTTRIRKLLGAVVDTSRLPSQDKLALKADLAKIQTFKQLQKQLPELVATINELFQKRRAEAARADLNRLLDTIKATKREPSKTPGAEEALLFIKEAVNDPQAIARLEIELDGKDTFTPQDEIKLELAELFRLTEDRTSELKGSVMYHGTTNEAAELIRDRGFSLKGAKRNYAYSELGPETVYFTRRKDTWLNSEWADSARALRYDTAVAARVKPGVKLQRISSWSDLVKLAKQLGFEASTQRDGHVKDAGQVFLDHLWFDVDGATQADNSLALNALKKHGIDGLDITQDIENGRGNAVAEQVAVFDADKVEPLKEGEAAPGKLSVEQIERIINATVELQETGKTEALRRYQEKHERIEQKRATLKKRMAPTDRGRKRQSAGVKAALRKILDDNIAAEISTFRGLMTMITQFGDMHDMRDILDIKSALSASHKMRIKWENRWKDMVTETGMSVKEWHGFNIRANKPAEKLEYIKPTATDGTIEDKVMVLERPNGKPYTLWDMIQIRNYVLDHDPDAVSRLSQGNRFSYPGEAPRGASTLERIESHLNDKMPGWRKVADAMREFYGEFHEVVDDAAYRRFGRHIEKNTTYGGELLSSGEPGARFGESFRRMTTRPGSLLERQGGKKRVEIRGAMDNLKNHIAQYARESALLEFEQDATALFMQDQSVRDEISRTIGDNTVKVIDKYLEDIVLGGYSRAYSKIDKVAQWLRESLYSRFLGARPEQFAKQITGAIHALQFVGPEAMIDGYAYMFSHPEWMKGIEESGLLQGRTLVRDPDFRPEATSKLRRFNNFTMKSVEVGDHYSIYGAAFPVYLDALKKTGSKEKALKAFETAFDTTQSSGSVDELPNLFRGNAILRLFTVMAQEPTRQVEAISTAWRKFRASESAADFAHYTRIVGVTYAGALLYNLMGWIVLYPFMSDDEREKKLNYILDIAPLGPFSGIAILGNLLSAMTVSSMKLVFNQNTKAYEPSLLSTDITGDVFRLFEKMQKLGSDGGDTADYFSALMMAGNVLGDVTGLPVTNILSKAKPFVGGEDK